MFLIKIFSGCLKTEFTVRQNNVKVLADNGNSQTVISIIMITFKKTAYVDI